MIRATIQHWRLPSFWKGRSAPGVGTRPDVASLLK